MKLRHAILTSVEDWLHRDPAMGRLHWLAGTLLIAPAIPIVAVWRWRAFEPPERNPDFRRKR